MVTVSFTSPPGGSCCPRPWRCRRLLLMVAGVVTSASFLITPPLGTTTIRLCDISREGNASPLIWCGALKAFLHQRMSGRKVAPHRRHPCGWKPTSSLFAVWIFSREHYWDSFRLLARSWLLCTSASTVKSLLKPAGRQADPASAKMVGKGKERRNVKVKTTSD